MKSIQITLLLSDNEYLTYPCEGTIEILEIGNDGHITNAVFRAAKSANCAGTPVVVKNPRFQYNHRFYK